MNHAVVVPAASQQQVGVQVRPGQRLDRSHVFGYFVFKAIGHLVVPNKYLIVVASRGQVVVRRPFQSANLLLVGLKVVDRLSHRLPQIPADDGTILAPCREEILVFPVNHAHPLSPTRMEEVLDLDLLFQIPNLHFAGGSAHHQFGVLAFGLELECSDRELEFHAVDGLVQITPGVDVFAEPNADQVVRRPVEDL